MLASYTWSKSIDDASNFFPSAGDPNYPQNSYDLRAERGRSNFDVRHTAVSELCLRSAVWKRSALIWRIMVVGPLCLSVGKLAAL